jgi:hypothetical protein
MNQDMVFQMGTMLAHAIHIAMACVAALAGALLLFETLGRLQTRERSLLKDDHSNPEIASRAVLPRRERT